MGRIVVHLALMAGSALVLAGCGLADSHAVLPEFLRTRAIEQPPPEPPPDVRRLVQKTGFGVRLDVESAPGASLAATPRPPRIALDGMRQG